ncbi:hypothetical protein B0J13DRAFT_555633 [Dactylonectria estremocensis]|uniref:DUF2423 domain-containing protein n=1 Tax=Dactylonectria estremocensis TaxID=1079267 RepID=A0A9P9EQT5_9HYPO|nr:hypothetical protein B0J13DRAFT_555633 [Dactylonectria estremocensis]
MAKSARSSSRKANNQRLAAKVFGPVEAARAERLHAKLLELAKQPKPESADIAMDAEDGASDTDKDAKDNETTMDVDSAKPSKTRSDKKRIDKRRVKKAGIVFRKYSDRASAKKKKKAPSSEVAS